MSTYSNARKTFIESDIDWSLWFNERPQNVHYLKGVKKINNLTENIQKKTSNIIDLSQFR